ncbi:MAG TPA: metallophosphoesterase [Syntrophomonadaceae bacterium]|nr:metallophosphoesterase [Syntrophomonadaceae bacterium]
MRIAIVADTHGRIDGIQKQLKKEKPELIFFAGDYLSDARRLSHHLGIGAEAVLGNCDRLSSGEWERQVIVAGCRFYIVHGHQYGVKSSLNTIYYRGQELEADAVVFGHTHIPCCQQVERMWLLNPGSAARPRIGKQPSYILLQVDENTIHPELKYFSP